MIRYDFLRARRVILSNVRTNSNELDLILISLPLQLENVVYICIDNWGIFKTITMVIQTHTLDTHSHYNSLACPFGSRLTTIGESGCDPG